LQAFDPVCPGGSGKADTLPPGQTGSNARYAAPERARGKPASSHGACNLLGSWAPRVGPSPARGGARPKLQLGRRLAEHRGVCGMCINNWTLSPIRGDDRADAVPKADG